MKKLLLIVLILSGIGSFVRAADYYTYDNDDFGNLAMMHDDSKKESECVQDCQDKFEMDSAEYDKCVEECPEE